MCFGIHGHNELGFFYYLGLTNRLDLLPEYSKRTSYRLDFEIPKESNTFFAFAHNITEFSNGKTIETVSFFGNARTSWVMNPDPEDHPAMIEQYWR